MCHSPLEDARIWIVLLGMDQDVAEQVRRAGCMHCGGVLHVANYPRKPRGRLSGVARRGIRTAPELLLHALSAPCDTTLGAVSSVARPTSASLSHSSWRLRTVCRHADVGGSSMSLICPRRRCIAGVSGGVGRCRPAAAGAGLLACSHHRSNPLDCLVRCLADCSAMTCRHVWFSYSA